MYPKNFTGALALIGFGAICDASEVVWPGWLGPERDGNVADFAAPDPWPERLEKVWSVDVGEGYGSPVVSEDSIYIHSREGEDEVLWKLALGTGEPRWRQSYEVSFTIGAGGEFHGKGPKASPYLHDGRVYTMSIAGALSAWDAETGDLLWRRDARQWVDQAHPYWGATTSPIASGKLTFIHFGGCDDGALLALDAISGDEVWRLNDDPASYSSPLIKDFAGARQLIEWNHDRIVSFDSESGIELWSYDFPHLGENQNMPTPQFSGGRIFFGGENRGLHCIEPQWAEGGWSVKRVWSRRRLPLDMATAIVHGDRLFGFSHRNGGHLFCVETSSGESVWEGPGRQGDNASFLSIQGHVVALMDHGELRALDAAADAYSETAKYQVSNSPTWAPPVFLKDGILIKDKSTLTFWRL